MTEQALRKLWQAGQGEPLGDAAALDSTSDALFAANDLAADAALDVVAESPRAAALVRAVAGLRVDAETLSRDIKQVRQPRVAHRSVGMAQRWPWAVAASLALVAAWMQPWRSAEPTAVAVVPAQTDPAPVVEANKDRILAASFEANPAEAETILFRGDFDS